MKNKHIVAIGGFSCVFHFSALLIYFLTLLISPNGASVIISLIVGVPFSALSVAGCLMIAKIKRVPSLYIFVSDVVLSVIYIKSYITLSSAFSVVALTIGAVAVLLGIITAVLALPVKQYYPNQKYLIIASLTALGLLCLAAALFLGLYSLIVLPDEGVSSLPIYSVIFFGRG